MRNSSARDGSAAHTLLAAVGRTLTAPGARLLAAWLGGPLLDPAAIARRQDGWAWMLLQPTTTATTVRVRDGKVLATDGPFAETREQLGGYYLIDAKDINAAIEIASRIPGARTGSIEVRPVWVYES